MHVFPRLCHCNSLSYTLFYPAPCVFCTFARFSFYSMLFERIRKFFTCTFLCVNAGFPAFVSLQLRIYTFFYLFLIFREHWHLFPTLHHFSKGCIIICACLHSHAFVQVFLRLCHCNALFFAQLHIFPSVSMRFLRIGMFSFCSTLFRRILNCFGFCTFFSFSVTGTFISAHLHVF